MRLIFEDDLKRYLYANTESSRYFSKFQEIFLNVLDIHAPMKKKYIRANEVPYMTKPLRKAMMTRSRFENKFHKTKSLADKAVFKRQRNYCNRLYKRERKKFYNNLELNIITDNRKFWSTMKPFSTAKGVSKNSIKLIEGRNIIVEDCEVADTLNIYFNNAVTSLGINEPADIITETQNINEKYNLR